MALYDYCKKLPYTISLQFNKNSIGTISKIFEVCDLNNKVSSHLSIKYLGYEECLTDEKISAILEKFTNLNIQKKDIEVVGFGIMDNLNPSFKNLLYLKVSPSDYLHELHNNVISLLDGMIDLYKCHDLKNFIPHITCGNIDDETVLKKLNEEFNKYEKLYISDWFIALHTSKRDYKII
jgi:2'-5' RNA ligase